jgi:uncharacterized protein (DUF4415 family)
MRMSKPPNRYRPSDPRNAAEAAFKKAATKTADPTPAPKKTSLPVGGELDVLEHFQEGGLGWQDRINQGLRKASGLDSQATRDEGRQPDQLASKND